MAFTVTRGLVDQQGLTLRVSCMAWNLRMPKRSMWLLACLDRSVLQEGSKGPLPQGACDSQPLVPGSMDQAVSMPHRVSIHSETSPI